MGRWPVLIKGPAQTAPGFTGLPMVKRTASSVLASAGNWLVVVTFEASDTSANATETARTSHEDCCLGVDVRLRREVDR